MSDDNYQHDKICPFCGKRTVYLRVSSQDDTYAYYCTSCGKEWKA